MASEKKPPKEHLDKATIAFGLLNLASRSSRSVWDECRKAKSICPPVDAMALIQSMITKAAALFAELRLHYPECENLEIFQIIVDPDGNHVNITEIVDSPEIILRLAASEGKTDTDSGETLLPKQMKGDPLKDKQMNPNDSDYGDEFPDSFYGPSGQ